MTEEQIKFLVQFSGTLATLATLLFGIIQYRIAQRWKKRELVASEAKAFFDNPMVQKTLRLMEWCRLEIDLPRTDPSKPIEMVKVARSDIVGALKMVGAAPITGDLISENVKIIDEVQVAFSPKEVHIRDVFDCYLDGLERFESYIVAGLIKAEDVKPYLAYWFGLMSGESCKFGKEPRAALVNYMAPNCYAGALNLMARCGYRIPAK